METNKHAYLIMVHKNPQQVLKLLGVLDDPRDVIVVHCDKKMPEEAVDMIRHWKGTSSELVCMQVYDNAWGSYSLVQTELLLVKEALRRFDCTYLHLLSGEDLPIKSQDYIHGLMDSSGGCEYISYCPLEQWQPTFDIRLRQKHLRNRDRSAVTKALDKAYVGIQKLAHVDMMDKDVTYGYGSEWFSITSGLAADLVEHSGWVDEHFSYARIPDEVFLQTFALTFGYGEKLYKPATEGDKWANLRLVDWKRGDGNHPYTFRSSDFSQLVNSKMLFARKFSVDVDAAVIDDVIDFVNQTGNQSRME